MEESWQQKVREFIQDIRSVNSEQAEILVMIETLFNEVSQELTEKIKYGGLVFFKHDTLIGGIFPYKNHISIEFSTGADFDDPSGLLEGKGKRRRHLKVRTYGDIDILNPVFFIEQAANSVNDEQ
jgi:hypothetical protein